MEHEAMINPTRIEEIVKFCLFNDDELPPEDSDRMAWAKNHGEIVHGITRTLAFHKGRLEESSEEIRGLIAQLPDTFDEGWSFLNMCNDKEGNQWTSYHQRMEELACLGQAVGVFECVAPREMWVVLPGGMPYYKRAL